MTGDSLNMTFALGTLTLRPEIGMCETEALQRLHRDMCRAVTSIRAEEKAESGRKGTLRDYAFS